ncbi:hypothetical protein OPQ81_000108 [Rhizoctonia solani]|nr:hypothetical protein OPQ81_000108 [Rhizoctonia solani]
MSSGLRVGVRNSILNPPEIRLHALPRPLVEPLVGPRGKVRRGPASQDHGVEARGAAEAAGGPEPGPVAVGVGDGLGEVVRDDLSALAVHDVLAGERDAREEDVAHAAPLDDQDRDAGVLREAGCHHASSCAAWTGVNMSCLFY